MERHYLSLIQEYLRFFPCVVLVGARQTGKSTLINMLEDGRELFDLEIRADYEQITHDPDLFLRLHQAPIAIDEAQHYPGLFPALRVAIDKDRQHYGKYLLSGSSSPELLREISESLAGRVGIIEIAPLGLAETQGVKRPNLLSLFSGDLNPKLLLHLNEKKLNDRCVDEAKIDEYWRQGGYPEPWLRQDDRYREVWREQYLKTYIERDIARLFPRLNQMRFRRFIELLASCSGTIINYANIANMLDISQPTVKDYFRIAAGTFIWRNIPAYTKNATKRVVKHPRGYLRDTGLLHHILNITTQRQLATHPQMGNSWEGMVIEEILRSLNAAGIQNTAYYYRTSGGAEIDLVLEGKFGLIPFEIKHTQTIKPQNLRSLKHFISEFDCPFGVIISRDDKVRLYEDNVIGLPFSMLVADEL